MRIDVITLFPEILRATLGESILGRAQRDGVVAIHLHQLRDWTHDKHRTVDDRPYGGGPGMVLKPEPIFEAVEAVQALAEPRGKVVLLTPSGRLFRQSVAREFSQGERLIFLTGHYEGVDQRVVEHLIDEEISIGDYVLTNGALAAAVVIDAAVRLLPGAVGNGESTEYESFTETNEGLLEGPQYTRPEDFRGWRVPDVLLSGHHADIEAWRNEQGRLKTSLTRPELIHPRQPQQ